MVLLVPLSNLLHLFPYATVTCCGPSSSFGCFLLSLDNRVNTFIQMQRKLLRCRFKGTSCADTCWTVCSDSCVPSCAVEVKVVSSHACLQPTGVGTCVVYLVSTSQIFFSKDFFFFSEERDTAEMQEENNHQTFISE